MAATLPSTPADPRPIQTVLGPVPFGTLGVADAHNHVWIHPVAGADPSSPVLDQRDGIVRELREYLEAGGGAILDCQPGGCGRDGGMLVELSKDSRVHIIACTGFHRKKYYSPDYWLWSTSDMKAADYFSSELTQGLEETRQNQRPVLAGFIKIAIEASLAETPHAALEGAAGAVAGTGAMVEIHTEKGSAAEDVVEFFNRHSVRSEQIVLCHMDKRADFGLHSELAQAGVMLEYDTFYRPKYHPEQKLWPLIEKMAAAGLAHRVALATDMAEAEMYRHIGGGPGLASLPTKIRTGLQQHDIPEPAIRQMIGDNIARRLAGLS